MLKLDGLDPFGIGGRRLCFVHPHDPNRCVKVLRRDERRTTRITSKRRIIPNRFRREYNNNDHEQKELEALHRRISDAMREHLPKSYGIEPTDMGPGLVLDLVRDDNGSIARSLRELITKKHPPSEFKPAFDEFSAFLLKHVILTRGLHDHNLVAQRRGDGWRLYLIDGLGDPAWLPLSRWVAAISRRRIRKRIALAWPKIQAFAETGGVTDEMLANSNWGQGFLRHRGECDAD